MNDDPDSTIYRSCVPFRAFVMHSEACTLAAAVFIAMISPAIAADSAKDIGAGMHAFHGGRYVESHDWLSGAIAAGTRDPRAFYFRGLAARRCGRELEAEADFIEGARLEATGEGMWNIGRSLERVQGADRVLLERYRAKARSTIAAKNRDATLRRYSDVVPDPDPSVFRRRRPEMDGGTGAGDTAPTEPAFPEPIPPTAEASPDVPPSTDDTDEIPSAEAPVAEEPVMPEAEEDPFEDDPFGDDPSARAEGEPSEREAAETEGADDAADERVEREADLF